MGIFGNQVIEAFNDTISSNAYFGRYQMGAVANQQAISISWWLFGDEPRDFKVAIYDTALNLLGQGTGTKTGDGWLTVTLDSPALLTPGAWYYLGGRAASATVFSRRGGFVGGSWRNWRAVSYANFPESPGVIDGSSGNKPSVYCTYEEIPPPPAPPRGPAYGLDPMVF